MAMRSTATNALTLACDGCGGRILATDTLARIGVRNSGLTVDAKMVFAHGECIARHFPYYFANDAARSLTVVQWLAEVAALT